MNTPHWSNPLRVEWVSNQKLTEWKPWIGIIKKVNSQIVIIIGILCRCSDIASSSLNIFLNSSLAHIPASLPLHNFLSSPSLLIDWSVCWSAAVSSWEWKMTFDFYLIASEVEFNLHKLMSTVSLADLFDISSTRNNTHRSKHRISIRSCLIPPVNRLHAWRDKNEWYYKTSLAKINLQISSFSFVCTQVHAFNVSSLTKPLPTDRVLRDMQISFFARRQVESFHFRYSVKGRHIRAFSATCYLPGGRRPPQTLVPTCPAAKFVNQTNQPFFAREKLTWF